MKTEPLQARAAVAAPETAVGEFMFMPGGTHTIFCKQGTKDVAAEVKVQRGDEALMQQQLEAVRSRGAQRPYCDFDHEGKEASFWPQSFTWRDAPQPGIYVRGEWSSAGKAAIEGKTYRAFSPVFHVDDVKKKPARIIAHPAKSLNFGGLVNDPAFTQICPIWAKHTGATASEPNQTHTPSHTMTKEQLAALQASITQLEQDITALVAASTGSAEDAEAIQAKRNELNIAKAQHENGALKARQAELETQLLAQRTKDAEDAVKAAVKRGAIPAKNDALQAAWRKKCIEDVENIPLLNGIAGSPALQAAAGQVQPYRLVLGNALVRESSESVLGAMGAISARQSPQAGLAYRDRVTEAKAFSALYAKEILPRLREGDDLPLSAVAANTLGTLASTLVATQTLELLTLTFPLLKMILTDFSDQIVSYGDTLKSRFIGIPAVKTYNTTTGWATPSDVTTTDISITYNQFKGVPIQFLGHELAGTVRRLFDELAPAQAYALGKDMVDYIYALITSAYTNTVTQAGLGTFGRSTLIDMGGILDDAGVPEIGRFVLLSRPYYSALSKDNVLTQMAAFQNAAMIAKGLEPSTMPEVEGFKAIKAVNLPATVISGSTVLKGFAGSKSSIALASRLSADYVNAIPGAGNGNLTVVTTPAGFSANLVQFVDHVGANATSRLEVIYGGSRGQVAAGALLTDV